MLVLCSYNIIIVYKSYAHYFIQWNNCNLRFGILNHLKEYHLRGTYEENANCYIYELIKINVECYIILVLFLLTFILEHIPNTRTTATFIVCKWKDCYQRISISLLVSIYKSERR